MSLFCVVVCCCCLNRSQSHKAAKRLFFNQPRFLQNLISVCLVTLPFSTNSWCIFSSEIYPPSLFSPHMHLLLCSWSSLFLLPLTSAYTLSIAPPYHCLISLSVIEWVQFCKCLTSLTKDERDTKPCAAEIRTVVKACLKAKTWASSLTEVVLHFIGSANSCLTLFEEEKRTKPIAWTWTWSSCTVIWWVRLNLTNKETSHHESLSKWLILQCFVSKVLYLTESLSSCLMNNG